MKIITSVVWLFALLFLASLVYAGMNASLFDASGQIWGMLWGKVMWADLYLGLFVFSLWIFIREKSPIVASLWTIALIFLGNLASLVYLAIALTCYLKSGDRKALVGGNFLKGADS